MTRFVVGDDRSLSTLFPERLDDYFGEDNPVWAVDIVVDELDLAGLSFERRRGRGDMSINGKSIISSDHVAPSRSDYFPIRCTGIWR